jgi:hypothetical protein
METTMTREQMDEMERLAKAAIPERHNSRSIDPGNPIWGPKLAAFKDAVWPETILSLLARLRRLEQLEQPGHMQTIGAIADALPIDQDVHRHPGPPYR